MELKKIENNLSPIATAISSQKIRTCDDKDLKTTVVKSLAKAFADTGYKTNNQDVEYLATTLQFEIKNQLPDIRIDEIPIAINKGIFGEYGEYVGLPVVVFISFLKKYMESESRKKAVAEFHKLQEPEKPTPSPEETLQKIKETIILAYQTFIEKGKYEDHGNFVYDKMDEMDLFVLTSEEKHDIFEQAKKQLQNKNNPKNAVNRSEFTEMSKTIDLLELGTGKKTIQTEAKKIALHQIFEGFKSKEIDIKSLVNQTKAF